MYDVRKLVTAHKAVTTAGTRVALSATKKVVRKLKVRALTTNTGVIYLGDVTVASTNGYPLAAGVELDVTSIFPNDNCAVDLNTLYIDAAVNGEGLAFTYFV
jgi:hypothetical protein